MRQSKGRRIYRVSTPPPRSWRARFGDVPTWLPKNPAGSVTSFPYSFLSMEPSPVVSNTAKIRSSSSSEICSRAQNQNGGGGYSFAAYLRHLTIDHASLSRRSAVPSRINNRDTSNVWTLSTVLPYIAKNCYFSGICLSSGPRAHAPCAAIPTDEPSGVRNTV